MHQILSYDSYELIYELSELIESSEFVELRI